MDNFKFNTNAVHGGKGWDSRTGSISIPIYQTATFKHPALGQSTGYDYTRTQNPTREKLEKTYSLLENGTDATAHVNGMAAINCIFCLLQPNDHVIIGNDLYGGTYRYLDEIAKKNQITYSRVDTTDISKVESSILSNTKAILYETPTNPMVQVTDIKKISSLAKSKKILHIVDNTFLTPYYQRPLDLGADIVVTSATKYIGGHNDTLCGLIAVNNSVLAERLRFYQNTIGSGISPFDSWLMIRGIKTLPLRMRQHQENAIQIAEWLSMHKIVNNVYYIGLKNHPSYDQNLSNASGFGGMISFEVKDSSMVSKILESVKVISFAESLGGVESLITYPIVQTHSAIPEEILKALGINDRLLRLSVGIESIEDLIDDLDMAMKF